MGEEVIHTHAFFSFVHVFVCLSVCFTLLSSKFFITFFLTFPLPGTSHFAPRGFILPAVINLNPRLLEPKPDKTGPSLLRGHSQAIGKFPKTICKKPLFPTASFWRRRNWLHNKQCQAGYYKKISSGQSLNRKYRFRGPFFCFPQNWPPVSAGLRYSVLLLSFIILCLTFVLFYVFVSDYLRFKFSDH